METKYNTPKQLRADRKVSSFIQDEKGNDVLLCYNDIDRLTVIERYNNYLALKTVAVTMTVLTGVLLILLFVY